MKMRCLVSAILLPAVAAAIGQASDSVKTIDGKIHTGEITQITPVKVVIERGGAAEELPSIEIQVVNFEGEPGAMKTVRNYVAEGKMEEAGVVLDKVEFKNRPPQGSPAGLRLLPRVSCRQAGVDRRGEIKDAGSKMVAWVNANPTNFHYYDACQILGDLLLALHRYDQACVYYNKLAESPFPEVKMRAGVATGRALLLAKKTAEAQKAFEAVLAVRATGDLADSQRLIATLGKARATIEIGRAGRRDQDHRGDHRQDRFRSQPRGDGHRLQHARRGLQEGRQNQGGFAWPTCTWT